MKELICATHQSFWNCRLPTAVISIVQRWMCWFITKLHFNTKQHSRILEHVLKHSHSVVYVQLYVCCRLDNFLLGGFIVSNLAKVIIARFWCAFPFLILVLRFLGFFLNFLNHRSYVILNRLMGQHCRGFRICLRILWFQIFLQH